MHHGLYWWAIYIMVNIEMYVCLGMGTVMVCFSLDSRPPVPEGQRLKFGQVAVFVLDQILERALIWFAIGLFASFLVREMGRM